MKKVCLLGASGNIGEQSLDIFENDLASFLLVGISIGHRINKLDGILQRFPSIKYLTVQEKEDCETIKKSHPNLTVFYGDEGLIELIEKCDADIIENALVGFVGLRPSIKALEEGKILCLANKESLVVGGEFINDLLSQGKGKLYPIDSEHVGVAKCLSKVNRDDVDAIIITGSGGAFRRRERSELENVTAKEALAHPTWNMGEKITIDCATMMNKGFEVLEAYYLFSWPLEKIEVVLHDESMVHAALRMKDGTYVADVSKPDMHGPIAYALYEGNVEYEVKKANSLEELGPYHFHKFDPERYPAVDMCKDALKRGGSSLAILNAADEEADRLFLRGKIKFLQIEEICCWAEKKLPKIKKPSLDDIVEIDSSTRILIKERFE